MITLLVVLVVLGALLFFVVSEYNKMVALKNEAINAKQQIDVQLDRRFKVLESLISIVKNYMDYEKSTLAEVVKLRNQAVSAKKQGNVGEQAQAEEQITTIVQGMSVVFEQYPDLKANTNALQLQEEIVSTENKLAFSKQAYNDSILNYSNATESFFGQFIVSFFPVLKKSFTPWELKEEAREEKEEYIAKM